LFMLIHDFIHGRVVDVRMGVAAIYAMQVVRDYRMFQNVMDHLGFGENLKDDFDTVLFIDKDGRVTFGEFCQRVARAASYFIEKGVLHQPVAVVADHCTDTLAWYLGVLASGNYYVPVNPDIKEEKLEKIKSLAGIEIVCRGGIDMPRRLSGDELEAAFRSFQEIYRNVPAGLPMYVIFTSGSTGEPKGIIKTHQSMMSFIDAYVREFQFNRETCLGSQTPFYFDASAKDVYTALKVRCPMHMLDSKLFLTPLKLGEYIRDNHINTLQWVPSALSIISTLKVFEKADLTTIRKVLFVGEVFPPKQLRAWMEALPDTEFVNLYGSSEMSGICAFYRVGKVPAEGNVPIGYPLSNSRLYLVDDGKVIRETETVGEIYVASDALAAGYLNDAEKTAAVFTGPPSPELPEGTYYRSGDLAKYGPNEELVFVSRRDYQIKHMGHRIELGEIEAITLDVAGVEKCCCVYQNSKIILFYTGDIDKADLSRQLRERLLSYMVPNKLVPMETLPLNANGKIDRTRLLDKVMDKAIGRKGIK